MMYEKDTRKHLLTDDDDDDDKENIKLSECAVVMDLLASSPPSTFSTALHTEVGGDVTTTIGTRVARCILLG